MDLRDNARRLTGILKQQEEVKESLRVRLKGHIKRHKIKQKDLADAAMLSQGRVSQILKGTFNPSLESLIILSEIAGLSVKVVNSD
jgi:transcriptional regulator with XRE-family HTH domain